MQKIMLKILCNEHALILISGYLNGQIIYIILYSDRCYINQLKSNECHQFVMKEVSEKYTKVLK